MATNALQLIGPIPRGRPSTYDDAMARDILERLWEGESLTAICEDEGMPPLRTVYKWLAAREDFRRDYLRARELQADTFAYRMQDVAENLALLPEHKRLILDTMKWRAARQNWRAWGDKVSHEHTVEVHTPVTADAVPEGIGWIRGQLLGHQPADGPEPGDSGVGEE